MGDSTTLPWCEIDIRKLPVGQVLNGGAVGKVLVSNHVDYAGVRRFFEDNGHTENTLYLSAITN